MADMSLAEIFDRIAQNPEDLLEIYVLDTTYEDWRVLIEGLQQRGYLQMFTKKGLEVPLQITPGMFTDGEQVDYLIKLNVGSQLWTSGFYSAGAIDFQGSANEVSSQQELTELIAFMTAIHELTGRRVLLLPETLTPESARPYVEVP